MLRWPRPHRFTYAILIAVSCAVMLMIVPGRVAITDFCFGDSWNKFEHGWPGMTDAAISRLRANRRLKRVSLAFTPCD